MDCDRDGGQRWLVRKWRALTLLVEWKVLALTLIRRTPTANLFSSLCGGTSACRAAPAPSQGNQTKAHRPWEAPLTAQRASAESPFPQPTTPFVRSQFTSHVQLVGTRNRNPHRKM